MSIAERETEGESLPVYSASIGFSGQVLVEVISRSLTEVLDLSKPVLPVPCIPGLIRSFDAVSPQASSTRYGLGYGAIQATST